MSGPTGPIGSASFLVRNAFEMINFGVIWVLLGEFLADFLELGHFGGIFGEIFSIVVLRIFSHFGRLDINDGNLDGLLRF